MKTKRITVTVQQIYDGYEDHDWDGVVGYGGKLDIRPKYQREFIYDLERQRKVIDTILNKRPLNIIYWVSTKNGNYELLDGQQRTLSICKFLDHRYHIEDKDGNKFYFDTLPKEQQQKILNYELEICVCEGDENEILEWFKTINISGLELKPQERLNAVYSGPWTEDARKLFSKINCAADTLGGEYMSGEITRQAYLEKVLKWISNGDIQGYMAKHRYDDNANELWKYFESVISWVKATFPTYREQMKGLDWGRFYNDHKNDELDPVALEKTISSLMRDDEDEIQKKDGIYEYVLYGDEKALNLRAFSKKDKSTAYERQGGICPLCKESGIEKHYEIDEMQADHIIPWSKGGKTTLENCQLLCARHNLIKNNHIL
ncbi:DUF262 domain-containing protein [Candidatus Saccharibacteria bacterium]|nr:DUF262 domain-containing protein [Candidatus Saccharibacteria bacterium]